MTKLIIVGGPTASGKTKIALEIAKQYNGELINADSRQIYKYLNIGTNKGDIQESESIVLDRKQADYGETNIKPWILDGVPFHLINIITPDKRFSVFDFKNFAEQVIQDIVSRGKLPILVGGTGMYIDAVIKNYELQKTNSIDQTIREDLQSMSINELQNKLKGLNSELFAQLNESDQMNPRRLIRQIEKAEYHKNNYHKERVKIKKYETEFFYPEYEWEQLKIKIDLRVEQMFEEGLIDETEKILEMGYAKEDSGLQVMGYRQVIEHLEGKYDLEKCKELVKIAHRQYARRQRTWFEGEGRGYELKKILTV